MPDLTDTYQCANCLGVFAKAWSDEEAQAEYATSFPGSSQTNEAAVVCDDCYNEMLAWKLPEQWRAE